MSEINGTFENIFMYLMAFIEWAVILIIAFVIPVIFTFINTYFLIKPPESLVSNVIWLSFSLATIAAGSFDSVLYGSYYNISIADWNVAIYPFEVHTPVSSEHLLTVLAFAFIGLAGYLLMFLPIKKTPPLLFVLCMAFMYFGVIIAVLWAVQTSNIEKDLFHIPFFAIFSLNMILLAANVTRMKIRQYNEARKEGLILKSRFARLERLLEKGERMPLIALVLFFPLLGIVLIILTLFGQDIDSIVKAWTQTSDWVLSTKQSPPPLEYQGHYLCTVAAEGHKAVVKPQRDGRRQGARITVNRQLCIANAFEQILEERTPRLHRAVRSFYDKYGLPVSRLITTKFSADIVYIIMKPLEWFFLIVLYLTDTEPERRIAVQYLPKNDRENLLYCIDSQKRGAFYYEE